jgi:DNA-binding transcriptional ArsR family regulator
MEPPTTHDVPLAASQSTDDAGGRSGSDPRRKAPGPARRFAEGRTDDDDDDRSKPVDPADLLAVLEDDYARRILAAVAEEARPARELMEACDASRATVYRRLNRLEEQDLVTARTEVHPDGHHRKVFAATLEEATISLGGDGVCAEVTLSAGDTAGVANAAARSHPPIGADD